MKNAFFSFCLFMVFNYSLKGQQVTDSIYLQEKIAFNKRIKQHTQRDSLILANPQILIEIKKNGDIFFEKELVSSKKLTKRIGEVIKNIVWQYDVQVAIVSAEVGTKVTYFKNVIKVLNKYKLRMLLKTS